MSVSVTVVIPTFDRRDFLAQALASALGQRDAEVEVVVVDDGSRDGCADVVEGAGDDRVRLVVHDRNRGLAAARNSALEVARGEWIAFLDDDDLFAPSCLASHLAALRRDAGATWSCAGLVHIDPSLRIIAASSPPDPERVGAGLRLWNVIPAPSCVVVSRRAIEEVGAFDGRFQCFSDWDLWLRLAAAGHKLTAVDRPLAAYRVHGQNLSGDPGIWEAELPVLHAKHGVPTDPDRPGAGDASLRRARAWEYLRFGRPRTAARRMLAAGREERDWRAYVLGASMLALPGSMRRVDAIRGERQVPAGWRREAEAWLRPYRSGTGA